MKNGVKVRERDSRNLDLQNYNKQNIGKRRVGVEERESTYKLKYFWDQIQGPTAYVMWRHLLCEENKIF